MYKMLKDTNEVILNLAGGFLLTFIDRLQLESPLK